MEITAYLAPLLIGAGLALLGLRASRALLYRAGAHRTLDNFTKVAEDARPVLIGSKAYKVRLAFGERAVGRETTVLYLSYAVAFFGMLILGVAVALPLWIAVLAAAGGAWLGVTSWVEGRWNAVKRQVEADLPLFLRNMGGMLLVTPNVLQALQDAIASLDEKSPLRAWMQRFADELQLRGEAGFAEMREEARRISPHLMLAVVEIGRLWETGGAEFARAFYQAANNQTKILSVRNRAQAELSGAKSTLRIILLVLGGALYAAIRMNPAPFSTPLGRISLFITLGLAVVGWILLQRMIDDVMK